MTAQRLSIYVYTTEKSLLWVWYKILLGILDQQAAYEVLSQLTGVAEILLIKVIVDS